VAGERGRVERAQETIQHRRSGRGALAVVLSVVGLLGVSCASVGPTKLVSTTWRLRNARQRRRR
jgi:hypothetical protein